MLLFKLDALRGILLARERTRVYSERIHFLEMIKKERGHSLSSLKRIHGVLDLISIDAMLNRNFCSNNVDEGKLC